MDIILGFLLLVILLSICFLCKSFSIKKPIYKKEQYWKLFQLGITVFLIGFVSNEMVAPLVSPRVSDIKIIPLYIQGEQPQDPENEVKYFSLFEVEYEIELPYFLVDDKLKLRLPGKHIYRNIDLITSFQENNPYYDINLPDEYLSGSFLPYNKIDGRLPIKINTNAREIKKIHAKFIIREIYEFHGINYKRSDNFWWTHSTISPIDSTGNDVTRSHMSLIGFGQDQYGNYYRFYDTVIKSLTDLEIKGLRIGVTKSPVFCDDGIELDKEYDKYISIDLQPREVKHILAISRVPDTKSIIETDVVFNFTYESRCYGSWLKYQEITGNK